MIQLERASFAWIQGLSRLANKHGLPFWGDALGGMWGMFFTSAPSKPIANLPQVQACNGEIYRLFWNAMLDHGVYLAPSAFEAGFVSLAHTPEVVQESLEAADLAMAKVHQALG